MRECQKRTPRPYPSCTRATRPQGVATACPFLARYAGAAASPQHRPCAHLINSLNLPRRNAIVLGAAGLVAASGVLHAIVLLHSSGAYFDIHSFSIDAKAVLHHTNIYSLTTRYPRIPLWLYVPALAELVARATHISFATLVRIPPCLADLAISTVLIYWGVTRFGWMWRALAAPAMFALNPVAILVSAGHGQYDSVVVLCMFVSTLVSEVHDRAGPLLLGIGIALKGFPALLLPRLLFGRNTAKWFPALALVVAPSALAIAVYTVFFGWSSRIAGLVLGYAGVNELGWSAKVVSSGIEVRLTEIAFGTFVLFAAYRWRAADPVAVAALMVASFCALGFHLSVQYLLWLLPFLACINWRWMAPYSAAAALSAIVFYSDFFPGALPWASSPLLPVHSFLYYFAAALPSLAAAGCAASVWLDLRRAERCAREPEVVARDQPIDFSARQ